MSDVRALSQAVDALAEVAKWYPGTADPARVTASQIKVAYGSKPPAPAAVLSLRRETVDTLTTLGLEVAEKGDLRPAIEAGDVAALTSFLSTHVEGLLAVDADGYYVGKLSDLADRLKEVVTQSQPARVKIGPCPEEGCGGGLKATVRPEHDLLPSVIRCDTDDEHQWTAFAWHALGRKVAAMRPEAVRRFLRAVGSGARDDLEDPRHYGVGYARDTPATRRTNPVVRGRLFDEDEDDARDSA